MTNLFGSHGCEPHGGQLNQAVRRWGIPRQAWLDLSTGISPWCYPVPAMPVEVWQRLPEDDDGLDACCRRWLALPAAAGCLPVAGSQAALQALPRLRAPSRVAVPLPGYREHGLAWARHGHEVRGLTVDDIDAALAELDVLVCINPNNPTGQTIAEHTLLDWHGRLASRGGWLVVDEAFLDASDARSMARYAGRPGLVVLRSLGKFFGLAGVRAGLLAGPPGLCEHLQALLGPWSLSHPARWLMARAIADDTWQCRQRKRLQLARRRLDTMLRTAGLSACGDSHLFAWCQHEQADFLHEQLARQAVLVRCFPSPSSLRFGLPPDEAGWLRLQSALTALGT